MKTWRDDSKTQIEIRAFKLSRLKELLSDLSEKHHHLFRQMYSHKDLSKPINEVAESITEEKIDWAIYQCENSAKTIDRKQGSNNTLNSNLKPFGV